MCGLVGCAGHLLYKDEFTVKRLLLADYFRGTDSTGLAAIRSDKSSVIAKVDSNPITLFDMERFKKALNGNASRAFIGHNRAATKGGVTIANAHPFQIGHITGAHNGTLCVRSIRNLEDAVGEKYGTDSELLFAAIAKLGIKGAIDLCYEGKESHTGAWALVWYNSEDNTLNFLRNKHRQLFYAFEKSFERLFWASEWWMIREALESSASGYELYTETSKNKKSKIGYFLFDENIHYKFDLDELSSSFSDKKRVKPKTKKIEGKPYDHGYQRAENFTNQAGFQFPNQATGGTRTTTCGSQKSNSTKQSTTTYRGNNDKKIRLLHFFGNDNEPYAGMVGEDAFRAFAFSGCSWCKKKIAFGDYGITFFERDNRVVCRDCNGFNKDTKEPPSRIYVRSAVFESLV